MLTKIVRLEPKQRRGTVRIELLLDTAAKTIAEKGIEGLSTSSVAELSGSSIGVVYRYFPNIRTLLQSLALRNMERYLKQLGNSLPENPENWIDGVDVAVDLYVEMMREEPGFRAIRFGDLIDGRLLDPDVSNGGMLSQVFSPLIHEKYGFDESAELKFSLEVAVETAEALMKRAFQLDADGDDRFIQKARDLARAELMTHAAQ